MTTSDAYNRRTSDRRIDELEKNLRDLLGESFRKHVKDLHVSLSRAEVENKVEEHDEMVASMDRIMNLLEGTSKLDLQGNVVGRKGGMAAQQEEMSVMLNTIYERTNGGVKVTHHITPDWTRGQKIAVIGVGTTIVLASLPGLVSLLRWVAELWVV